MATKSKKKPKTTEKVKCNCWSPIWRGLRSIQRPNIWELKGLVDNL